MLKKLFSAAALLSLMNLHAQEYINSFTTTLNASVTGVQMSYNSSAAAPEMLYTFPNGFCVNRFNESTGAITTSYNHNGISGYTPVCSAFNGGNKIVAGYTATDIYLHYLNSGGSAIYVINFPRMNNADPVDIVYDGSGFFYLLLEAYTPTNPTTILIYKIDAATGNCITGGRTTGNTGESFIPQDIELQSASALFVTGIYVDASGTRKYFIAKVHQSTGKVGVNDMEYLTYGTASVIPSHCYLKISGSNFYFACDATTTTLSATKLVFMTGAYSNVTTPHTTISVTNIYQNFDCNRMTSVDYFSGNMVVGFAPYSASSSIGGNFQYNVSTFAAQIRNYNITGDRNIRSVFLPATSRIFSGSARGKTWHNLRTQVLNPTVTTVCAPTLTYLPTGALVTAVQIPDLAFFYGLTYTPVVLSSLPTATPWTKTVVCSNALPAQSGNDLTGVDGHEAPAAGLQLFPNPAENNFSIRLSENPSANARYEVYSMTGTLVSRGEITDNATSISVTDWAPGIYLVRVLNGETTYTERLVRN